MVIDNLGSNARVEKVNFKPQVSGNGAQPQVKNDSAKVDKVTKKDDLKEKKVFEGKTMDGDESKLSENSLDTVIKQTNNKIRMTNTKCEYSYHEETKRISILVKDKETDKVIREIPAEETLEMISKLWEIAGLMVDEKR
ncbi:MAG: flagellar protein FlaG [Lachnospiraceae bacterium]|nr:flagellar protein FlaG [Lachnospiraceae bacterium]